MWGCTAGCLFWGETGQDGDLSLPQGAAGGAEVQRGQPLVALQVGVRLVLQQQLHAVRVPPLAGFVQGRVAPRGQVGVGASQQEVTQAGGVAMAGGDAQRGAQLLLVLQGPQPCRDEGEGLNAPGMAQRGARRGLQQGDGTRGGFMAPVLGAHTGVGQVLM